MSPLQAPIEWDPPWAFVVPPRLGELRVGVFYAGVPLVTVAELLRAATPVFALGAVGRRLFWGRTEGPWIPYDRRAPDQNAGTEVCQRPWPWCWGDEVWGVVLWEGLRVMVHLSVDGCALFATRCGSQPEAQLQAFVVEHAQDATDRHAALIDRAALTPLP